MKQRPAARLFAAALLALSSSCVAHYGYRHTVVRRVETPVPRTCIVYHDRHSNVYFDSSRSLYFYLEGPEWVCSAILPTWVSYRHHHATRVHQVPYGSSVRRASNPQRGPTPVPEVHSVAPVLEPVRSHAPTPSPVPTQDHVDALPVYESPREVPWGQRKPTDHPSRVNPGKSGEMPPPAHKPVVVPTPSTPSSQDPVTPVTPGDSSRASSTDSDPKPTKGKPPTSKAAPPRGPHDDRGKRNGKDKSGSAPR